MLKIIIRLGIVILIHVILFAAYPDTGKNGNLFLGISLFCWIALLFMASSALRSLPVIGRMLSAIFMLVFYGMEIAVTAYLMPQTDNVTVYDKILKGKYPDYSTLRRGLRRFGVDTEEVKIKAGNAIEKQVDKAVDAAVKEIEKNKKESDAAKQAEKQNANQDEKAAK